MKLHRLRVRSFAAIRDLEIAFGPGLNVLYGPNDLGKSTLAEAIRLALLLPCTSTDSAPYVSWSGAEEPFVDLTFETEEQRIWRVQKQFGKRGTALLQESRNGRDFEDVERARRVDARLREILGWGIPEPGGTGAGKGLPESFLATALLSTQANVTDVLAGSLLDDPTATGKEQIAKALEAVAQDPLFAALLRETQARRDEAFTDKGAKKTARGSILKMAADRVTEARKEKERLQKIVEDSEGVEHRLRSLLDARERREQDRDAAAEHLAAVERLARQAAERDAAAEQVRLAQEKVQRIRKMGQDAADAEQKVGELAARREQAERSLQDARAAAATTAAVLAAAEEEERSAAASSALADTVARQDLELKKAAAEQSVQAARQRLAALAAVRKAEEDHRKQEAEAARATETWENAVQAEKTASEALRRCDLLAYAWEARAAEKQRATAQEAVDRLSKLQSEQSRILDERVALTEQRAALAVPAPATLTGLRKLATDLASARGALDVGLVMTVIPTAIVPVRVRKDGATVEDGVAARPLEIEADTEIEVDIADLATVRVRGGRREAQEKVQALENRWKAEFQPYAPDLETLEAKVAEARDLDARIQSLDGKLDNLQRQTAALAGAAETLRDATARSEARREDLDGATPESFAADLGSLGSDPAAALRARRQKAARDAETAKTAVHESATAQALAEERLRALREALDAARADLPEGPSTAEDDLQTALKEQDRLAADLAILQTAVDARKGKIDAALQAAKSAAETANHAVAAAQEGLQKAIADHATADGRLAELRKLRDAEDLPAAESLLQEATERHAALPVPEHPVTPADVAAAQQVLERIALDIKNLDKDIHITQGALQQVGGAVARDHLRDATEACELAERQEREIEADYDAWKLLLETMKEADAAQASNLGLKLAPAIADRFQSLTRQRYQSVQLTAHLGTEGIVVAGAVKPYKQLSVGTREQLSTLYRLCLGEYLRTTIVLDDQLVQSDETRMDWFRTLLTEKARTFQIIVFTCRPGDYLAEEAMVKGKAGEIVADSADGFVRAVDLGRGVRGAGAGAADAG